MNRRAIYLSLNRPLFSSLPLYPQSCLSLSMISKSSSKRLLISQVLLCLRYGFPIYFYSLNYTLCFYNLNTDNLFSYYPLSSTSITNSEICLPLLLFPKTSGNVFSFWQKLLYIPDAAVIPFSL